jgi:hypothetical protein
MVSLMLVAVAAVLVVRDQMLLRLLVVLVE